MGCRTWPAMVRVLGEVCGRRAHIKVTLTGAEASRHPHSRGALTRDVSAVCCSTLAGRSGVEERGEAERIAGLGREQRRRCTGTGNGHHGRAGEGTRTAVSHASWDPRPLGFAYSGHAACRQASGGGAGGVEWSGDAEGTPRRAAGGTGALAAARA